MLDGYRHSFDERIAGVLPDAARRIPGLADRLRASGLDPAALVDADSLDRVPVLTKDELLELQTKNPPFGGMLAPGASVRRVFQSPGPLYEPELDEPDAWGWSPALDAAGFGPSDVVLNAFGYHLSPAGAMFEEGARGLGCTVVPAGVGSFDLQVQAMHQVGVTAYIGLPSYLKVLLERAEEAGLAVRLHRAFVTAEPLPHSLRGWLRERVPLVLQGYGTAEAGNLGYECDRMDGLHVPADALVEVCGLDDGKPLLDGSEGQVVVTRLSPDYPLVRLGTGDLSAFAGEPCECGRPSPRLVGWLGRVGDAVKVRGMFLHPRQVHAVMDPAEGVAAYRFVVDRVEHRDVLRCEVAATPDAHVDALREALRARIRSGLRFDCEVVMVDALESDGAVIADIRSWD